MTERVVFHVPDRVIYIHDKSSFYSTIPFHPVTVTTVELPVNIVSFIYNCMTNGSPILMKLKPDYSSEYDQHHIDYGNRELKKQPHG